MYQSDARKLLVTQVNTSQHSAAKSIQTLEAGRKHFQFLASDCAHCVAVRQLSEHKECHQDGSIPIVYSIWMSYCSGPWQSLEVPHLQCPHDVILHRSLQGLNHVSCD